MPTCDFCGFSQETRSGSVSFHKFPEQEEHLRPWRENMGRDAAWTPCDSSALCSNHFTPDCFDASARLHSNAIPTLFDFTHLKAQDQNIKDTENLPQDKDALAKPTNSKSHCCDCYKRLQATEKFYQLKLNAAQLQIKEYRKNLSEESKKAMKWQKRAIVLQSAIRAMRQSQSMPATRKTSTPKTNSLD